MKLLAVLALASQVAFAANDVQNFKIDPAHTAVIFKVNHMGFSDVYGQFSAVDGKFTVSDKPSLELAIKADSISTLSAKRDEHLRGPDFFNVKQYPDIKFKSTKVKKTGEDFEVTGDLTLHGVTKAVTFVFHHAKTGKDPWGNTRFGGSAEFTIKRSDYKMTFMSKPGEVGDEIKIMISAEGTQG